MINENYIIELRDISKRFPGVQALNNVTLKVKPGSVHTLMGENGAGKSTLVKILMGVYIHDEGDVFVKGELVQQKSIHQRLQMGISMIHQELAYVPDLTVAQNMFLGKEKTILNESATNDETKTILGQIGLSLDPRKRMRELSVAERQMVEIAKAVFFRAELIIMDEPTSAISDKEVDRLFELIHGLKKKNVAIIYISHKMDEIFRISDEITVLRDGALIGSYAASDLDIDKLVTLMVGRELQNVFPKRNSKVGEEILRVSNLTRENLFKNISFTLSKGEVLGFAGLMGAGRTEIANCIYGMDTYDQGEVRISDKLLKNNRPKESLQRGVGFLSEDRKGIGLVLPLSVRENLTLSNLNAVRKGIIISSTRERKVAAQAVKDLNIKTPSTEQIVVNLSGGNQQKVVLGKAILNNPNILIMDEPTRGIDVGAKAEIYKLIAKLADEEGKAILFISSELPELLGLCDRILVFHEGELTGELSRDEFSQEKIMKYAIGEMQREEHENAGK